jgi:aspartate dehydrogenase
MPLRLAVIGWGAITQRFVALLSQRNAGAVEIVAVGLRSTSCCDDLPKELPVLTDPAGLAAIRPDLVVEAAGRDAVAQWGEAALSTSPAFAVASTSAFCDDALLETLLRVAASHGSQLLIPAGALAGVDGLAAAATLGLSDVLHSIVKPPAAWRGTPAEEVVDLGSLSDRTTFFTGTAREAARRFPQNANVAAITALAGLGLDATRVELVADPAATRNGHRIRAEGAFGSMDLAIENRPLAANPKSSEMTALNLVRLVENRYRPLVC